MEKIKKEYRIVFGDKNSPEQDENYMLLGIISTVLSIALVILIHFMTQS